MSFLDKLRGTKGEPTSRTLPSSSERDSAVQAEASGAGFASYVERWDSLDSNQTKVEVERLISERRFADLVAVVSDAKYPGRAQEALKHCDDDEASTALIALLQDESHEIRCRAAGALGPLGGERAAEELCRLLPNANFAVSEYQSNDEVNYIAWALADLRWPGAVPFLTAALGRATYFYHRVYLAKALALSGGREGTDFLIDAIDVLIAGKSGIKMESVGLQEYCSALITIDDPAAVPAMQKSLSWLHNQGDLADEIREFLKRHGAEPSGESAPTTTPDAPQRQG